MKYCQSILNEITFNLDCVLPCCSPFSNKAPRYFKTNSIEQTIEDIDFKKERLEFIKQLNTNLENFSCKNCIHLKEDPNLTIEKIENEKYKSIYLRYWTVCNCNCVYCDNIRDRIYGEQPKYSPINTLKNLYENNLIDPKNVTIRVQGGDLSCLPEFDELISLFKEKGFGIIHFSTNNFIYKKQIEEILKAGKGSLNISIDSGTRKIYKKIKRVDKFDDCINNLKTYIQNTKNPNCITVHYILVNGYNDSKTEIKNFIKLMKKIGINHIGIRIDHKDLNECLNNNTVSDKVKKYKNLVSFFYDLAKKNSFKIDNDLCIEQNFVIEKNQKQSIIQNFFKLFKL